MNILGVHSHVWASQWNDDEGRRAIAAAAAAGFDQIVIPLRDLSVVNPDRLRPILEENRIAPVNGLALDPGTDISSDDPETVARGETLIMDAISVARDLGSRRLGGVYYSALAKHPRLPTEAGRHHSIEVLARAAEKAKAAGFPLALEVVNRYETNLLTTGEQAMTHIAATGSDNIFVHLDTYHMNIEETDFGRVIELCADKLGYFEIGESHRGRLGTGNVDFRAAFRALARIDYTGPLGFEAFSGGIAGPGLAAGMALWRRMWEDSDELARHGREFILREWDAARRAFGLDGIESVSDVKVN